MWFFGKKTVGLGLGGGGARGFFHMGVVKAIQEKGIKIDKIAGTSIGAVVGAMYAANPDIDFEKIAAELDYFKILKTIGFGLKDGSGKGIEALLKSLLPVTDFSELKIPFGFTTTDINRKKEVVFNQGPLFPGLLATVSIPGIFPPVKVDENYLVDGGVLNNVPVSLVSSTNKLIVSDITGSIKAVDDKSKSFDVIYSSISLMQYHGVEEDMRRIKNQKVTYLHLKDNDTFMLDFRKKNYQKLIDLGYRAMMESGF
jgi:NTE family protein